MNVPEGEPTKSPLAGDKAPSSLAFLLSQVGIFASARFADAIAEAGLQPPGFRVLNVIDASEGSSQHTIGEAIQAPASRMVAIVDDLEADGLVERRPHPGDRRVRALHLTPAGRKALAAGRKIAKAHEQRLTEGMSQADAKRLIKLLQQLASNNGLAAGVHPGISMRKPGEVK